MHGGNTLNLVSKRIRKYFPKIQPLKKIFQFQDRICFFTKSTKNPTFQEVTGGETPNLVLKKMLALFLKIPTLKIRFYYWKKAANLIQKRKFQAIIKPMIENLKDEICYLENKQAKGAKLRVNIRYELEGGKWSKTFFNVIWRQNKQNQTIFKLYTDDNKTKYSSNPKDILKSWKKDIKNSTPSKVPQLLFIWVS